MSAAMQALAEFMAVWDTEFPSENVSVISGRHVEFDFSADPNPMDSASRLIRAIGGRWKAATPFTNGMYREVTTTGALGFDTMTAVLQK